MELTLLVVDDSAGGRGRIERCLSDAGYRVLRSRGVEPRDLTRPFEVEDFREAMLAFEKEYLERKLRANDFNVSRTAARLGLDRTSIHRKMKQLGILPAGSRR